MITAKLTSRKCTSCHACAALPSIDVHDVLRCVALIRLHILIEFLLDELSMGDGDIQVTRVMHQVKLLHAALLIKLGHGSFDRIDRGLTHCQR